MKMKYKLHDKYFRTKKDKKDFIRSILWRYEPEQVLSNDDYNYIFELGKDHPTKGHFFNETVKNIFISKDGFGGQNFNIRFKDMTEIHFSYSECLNPSTKLSLFSSACRTSVIKDILKVKNDFFKGDEYKISQISDKIITWDTSEVDHVNPTFNHIRDSFISLWSVNINEVKYSKCDKKSTWFEDFKLSDRFNKYHKSVAYFLIVHKDENSERSKYEKSIESKYLRIEK